MGDVCRKGFGATLLSFLLPLAYLKQKLSSDTTSESSMLELKQLRAELAEVYKQKSRNDQSLIEANRKLDQHDALLSNVTKE